MSTKTQYKPLPMTPRQIDLIIRGQRTIDLRPTRVRGGFYTLSKHYKDAATISAEPAGMLRWPLGDRFLALRHEIAAKAGYGEQLESFEHEMRDIYGPLGEQFLAGERMFYLLNLHIVEVLE